LAASREIANLTAPLRETTNLLREWGVATEQLIKTGELAPAKRTRLLDDYVACLDTPHDPSIAPGQSS
jgi:hypothetical protein